MELMAGGDVFDRIIDLNNYTEKDARNLAKILLGAVDYMHKVRCSSSRVVLSHCS